MQTQGCIEFFFRQRGGGTVVFGVDDLGVLLLWHTSNRDAIFQHPRVLGQGLVLNGLEAACALSVPQYVLMSSPKLVPQN